MPYPEPSDWVRIVVDEATYNRQFALRCPECGGEIVVKRLEVEDEKGYETVFLFSCTNGDFSVGATAATVDKIVAETIVSRLGEQ